MKSVRKPWIYTVALQYTGDDCLIWPFSVRGGRDGEGGYPALSGGYGHRLLCLEAYGEAPSEEHEVEHTCGNRRCMNPKHVRWATHKENCERRTAHGTQTIGEKHPGARLTEKDIKAIRSAPKRRGIGRELANEYGVSPANISLILKGKLWKHVK